LCWPMDKYAQPLLLHLSICCFFKY
jgi:hypothetical protein